MEGFLSLLKSLSNSKDKEKNKRKEQLDISITKKEEEGEGKVRKEERRGRTEEGRGRKDQEGKTGGLGKKEEEGRSKIEEGKRDEKEKEKRREEEERRMKEDSEDLINKEIILFGDLRKCLQIVWLLLNGPIFSDLSEIGEQIKSNFSKRRVKPCARCQLGFDTCVCYGELNFNRNEEWKKAREMLPSFKKGGIQILIDKESKNKLFLKNSNSERNSQNEFLNKKSIGEKSLKGKNEGLMKGYGMKELKGKEGGGGEKKKESVLDGYNNLARKEASNSKNKRNESSVTNQDKIKNNNPFFDEYNTSFSNEAKLKPSLKSNRSVSPSKSKGNNLLFEMFNTPNFKNIPTEGVLPILIDEILSKKEKRVIFIENDEILKYPNDKNKVFIDCRIKYQHNLMIKDLHGKNIGLVLNDDGSIVVNAQKKLVTEKGVLKNVFGLGEGFKTRKGEHFK